MSLTSPASAVDPTAVEDFAGRLAQLCTGTALTFMIDLGRRTGLFEAAARGPATSHGLAERAGLRERYVREWLAAMATGGIVAYDPATRTYALPPAHAVCLTGDRVDNLAPLAWLCVALGRHVPAVADAFRSGAGVPYADYLPELHDVMEALWGPGYDHLLVDQVLPLAPGLPERLRAGARVADVCCGTGHAVMTLAAGFPDSHFVGFDLDATAIARARDRAAGLGLANAAFEVCDAADLPAGPPFDAVLVFNAVHDQAAPARVLRRIHDALAPGGTLLMNEPALSARLEDNLADPMAPFVYAVSTLHCLTVSLAAGGAGLGTGWGWQVACEMLAGAGFAEIARHDAPGAFVDLAVVVPHKAGQDGANGGTTTARSPDQRKPLSRRGGPSRTGPRPGRAGCRRGAGAAASSWRRSPRRR